MHSSVIAEILRALLSVAVPMAAQIIADLMQRFANELARRSDYLRAFARR